MNLGRLILRLTANVSEFERNTDRAVQAVEKVSKKIKKLGNEAGQMGAAIGAAMIAAANHAAKFDRTSANAVNHLKGQFDALAVEVGRTVAPALNRMADAVGNITRFIRALDPETKRQIVAMAEWAVKIGVVTFVVGKVAGVVENLAEGISLAFDVGLINPFLLKLIAVLGVAMALKVALDKTRVPSAGELQPKARGGTASEWERFATFLKIKMGMVADPKGVEKNWDLFKPPGESRLDGIGKAVADALGPQVKDIIDAISGASGGSVAAPHALIDVGANSIQRARERSFSARQMDRFGSAGGLANLSPLRQAYVPVIEDLRTNFEVFVNRIDDGLRELAKDLTSRLIASSGAFGDVLAATLDGAAKGGEVGAIIGGLGALLGNSKTFQTLGNSLNRIMQSLADMFGALIEPVLPLVNIIGQVLALFSTALTPVFRGLMVGTRLFFEVVKPVAFLIGKVAQGIAWAFNKLAQFVAWIFESLGDKTTAKAIRGQMVDLGAMDDALNSLLTTTYDAALANEQLADSARDAAEAILNAPSGFRAGAYRYAATDTSGTGGASSGGGDGGGGINVGGDLIVQVTEPRPGQLAADIKREIKRDGYLRTGTTVATGPKYAWGT